MPEVMVAILLLSVGTFFFGFGLGGMSTLTVNNAITTIKDAEDRAKTTLAQITAHKAH